MRVASISIGIGNYKDRNYRESTAQLKHAQSDAKAFSKYAQGADDDKTDMSARHKFLIDREANLIELRSASEAISSAGNLDLFMLYLSGHGEPGSEIGGGWFCLFDAEGGLPSLTANLIDEVLRKVKAANTLLIIDCCFAEAVISTSRFFTLLGSSRSRLAIASARTDQRSWEDEDLKRSLFSDVLIRSLSVGSAVADAHGYVDVERALFPALREQVPLLASSRKAARQEPVTLGIAAEGLRLPTVVAASLGRPLSISEAVRAGVRRTLLAGLIAAATALVGLELFVYHLAVDVSGAIVVRPGLKETFGLQPLHVFPPIDTGIRLEQVARQNDEGVKRLADGRLWGFRTHLDADGLRTWLAAEETMLGRRARQSIDVFARSTMSQFKPDDDTPPLLEAGFLSLLNKADPTAVGRSLYPRDLKVGVPCEADARRVLDFTLFSSSSEVFAADASWMEFTAPRAPDERTSRLSELLRLAAYRSQAEKDDAIREREFRSFATAVVRFFRDSGDEQAFSDSLRLQLSSDRRGWCALHAVFVAALVQPASYSHEAEQELWRVLFTYDRNKQGDIATAAQTLAGLALSFVARVRDLDQESIIRLAKAIDESGADFDLDLPMPSLLREIGSTRGYPEPLEALLESKLEASKKEFDFTDLAVAKLLACAKSLASDRRERFRDWLQKNTERNRTQFEFQTALGCASATGPLEQNQLKVLLDHLSPESRFPPPSVGYRGETVITSNGDAAAAALGQYLQRYPLPNDQIEQLVNIAISRPDLEGRQGMLRGLAQRWYSKDEESAEPIVRRLSRAVSDSRRMTLEVEVAADHISSRPANVKERTLGALLARWQQETEPEIRMALAKLLGTTRVH
ncbi:caspase family protein [Bradyrhizobium sp. 48]|uniref:caspase family protein n=1 Tax=Bradyrhizobium sp. 48 TaxID=2782676 RepID=UPI001FF7E0E4|nr:caspase family protein [Bradyrhizobium sp. 48]MCK1446721.1 caspase family protein [Bradyrhizobium sp. 48]